MAEGVSEQAQAALIDGLTAATLDDALDVPPADRALLEYAETLTREPWAITRAHIGRLRESGFDDRAIHDACAIVAYFAFVNRIADGLGVEMET